MFGILPTRIHGVLDYLIGLSLVVMPFILGRGAGPQTWLPVVMGGGMIVYSLLTEYEMGVVPLIGMPTHLILDGLGGMFLASSPWMWGSLTSFDPAPDPRAHRRGVGRHHAASVYAPYVVGRLRGFPLRNRP